MINKKSEKPEKSRITVVVTEAYKDNKDLEGYIGLMEQAMNPDLNMMNPKITIPKDGKDRVIWGCECWWGTINTKDIGDRISEEQLRQLKAETQKTKVALNLLALLSMEIESEQKPDN